MFTYKPHTATADYPHVGGFALLDAAGRQVGWARHEQRAAALVAIKNDPATRCKVCGMLLAHCRELLRLDTPAPAPATEPPPTPAPSKPAAPALFAKSLFE